MVGSSLAEYWPILLPAGMIGYAYLTKTKKAGLPIELGVCPSGVSKRQGENITVTISVINNGSVNPGPVYIEWMLFDKNNNTVASNKEHIPNGLPPKSSTISKTSDKIDENAAVGTGELYAVVISEDGTILYAEARCPIEIKSGIEIKITKIEVS